MSAMNRIVNPTKEEITFDVRVRYNIAQYVSTD